MVSPRTKFVSEPASAKAFLVRGDSISFQWESATPVASYPERLKLQRNNKNQKVQTNIDGKSEIKPKLRSPQTKRKHSTERVSRD